MLHISTYSNNAWLMADIHKIHRDVPLFTVNSYQIATILYTM